MSIQVALVDDQTLVRSGIRSLLALSDKVTVIAEGGDGEAVTRIASEYDPDVFLVDIRMPKLDGIGAIRALREAGYETPVIILTTFDEHRMVLDGIAAGAQGYLLKDVSLDDLICAIESVHDGGTMIRPAITETLIKSLRGQDSGFDSSSAPEPLSTRETEVLRLMAGGYSNKEISVALSKSEGTIKNQVSSILAKMGVRDRTRAVLKAIELGIL